MAAFPVKLVDLAANPAGMGLCVALRGQGHHYSDATAGPNLSISLLAI